jgi:hypothetical protein
MGPMPRQHGTGRIYVKWGAFYGRWRTPDGRYVNRRLGKVRERGSQRGYLAAKLSGRFGSSWRPSSSLGLAPA